MDSEVLSGSINDARLIRRAFRERWPISDEVRALIIARQAEIASGQDQDATPREQTSAFNAILAAEAQNQADESDRVTRRVEHVHTHELGPVTAENLAEHKRRLLEELGP